MAAPTSLSAVRRSSGRPTRLSLGALWLVGAALAAPPLLGADDAEAMSFPRVREIEPNVTFWRNVYASWSVDEIAFHDREDFRLVYRVVKVPSRGAGKARRAAIVKAESELKDALAALDKKRPKSAQGLTGVELEVYERLKGIDRDDKYRRVGTLRAQNGLRERFVKGYRSAGAYEPQIRQRLKDAGLPEEIIALAYLESLMDIRAESHAGALGMWQFMRPTAKEYMAVNHVVDERMDPIIAADAAAKYIKTALANVGPWPVAITSYNYGRAGMKRAIHAVGSDDLGVILRNYQHGRFGLAARNYYASFLAVHDVLENPRKYLGNVSQRGAWRYEVVRLPFPVTSTQLVGAAAISQDDLVFLNPALTKAARTGQEVLPTGLPLRVPRGKKDEFLGKVLAFSVAERRAAEAHVRKWHKANGRQDLKRIAGVYGVSADDVAAINGLPLRSKPRKGQKIAIPSTPVKYSLFYDAKNVPIPAAAPLAPSTRVAVQAPPTVDDDDDASPDDRATRRRDKKAEERAAREKRAAKRKGGAGGKAEKRALARAQQEAAKEAKEQEQTGRVKLLSLESVPLPAGRDGQDGLDGVDLVTSADLAEPGQVDAVAGEDTSLAPPAAEQEAPPPRETPLSDVPTS